MTAGKLKLNTSNIAPCLPQELLKKKGIYGAQKNEVIGSFISPSTAGHSEEGLLQAAQMTNSDRF